MINQWADWVNDSTRSDFTAPIFTPEEQQALASFHEIWNEVAGATPDPLPPASPVGAPACCCRSHAGGLPHA